MDIGSIVARLNELSCIATQRKNSCSLLELHDMDMLTHEERVEMHSLKLMLPLIGNEIDAARARIRERIASGKRGKTPNARNKPTLGRLE